MTHVYYFGAKSMQPFNKQMENLNDVILKVSFDPNELQVMDSEEEYKFYEDYISLIRNIEEDELKFRSVSCSKSTALLIDETDELWIWGKGLSGQLGIDKIKKFRDRPFNLSRFTQKYFLNATCSSSHTMGITTYYKLYSWGET